jgi:membrane protease YdiL (CAAX protease family)
VRPRALVWNVETRRPRLPVRLALALARLAGVSLALGQVGPPLRAALERAFSVAFSAATAETLANVFLVLLAGTGVVLALVVTGRFVDRRRVADYGFGLDRDWWLDLGFGLVLGALLLTLVFLLELAAGWVRVTGTFVAGDAAFRPAFAGAVAVFLVVAVVEEVLLRGFLLTNLAEASRWRLDAAASVVLATLLSSGLFGLLHAANPNATPVSTASVGLAGVLLALGYVLTGELAIPIGLHFTWNLFQGPVYGFPVSGLDVGVTVVAVEQTGPVVLTGSQFGPEAGLVGVGAVALGMALTVAWVRYRTGDAALATDVATPDLRWRAR